MKYSVLIIEDCKEILENLTEILMLQHYNVLCAANGEGVINFARKKKPDIILCDILMREISGFDVLKKMKDISELATIPFIFITSQSENTSITKALMLGADDYIIKPFDAEQLLQRMHALLPKGSKDFACR